MKIKQILEAAAPAWKRAGEYSYIRTNDHIVVKCSKTNKRVEFFSDDRLFTRADKLIDDGDFEEVMKL